MYQNKNIDKVRVGGAIKIEHQLSPKTVEILLKIVDEVKSISKFKVHNTEEMRKSFIEHPSRWNLKENSLPENIQKEISKFLKKIGYTLDAEYSSRQALLCFGNIQNHHDADMRISSSTCFIPLILPRNEPVRFHHHLGDGKGIELNEGDIVVFNQNLFHSLKVVQKENDNSFGFGLSLFLKKYPSEN